MSFTPLILLAVMPQLLLLAGGGSPYYEVPEPVIEALSPRGLRISIPDEPGVELFAVHANVNKPMMNLEAGQISTDITKARNGRWVFEDKRVRLKPGDVINFWLYVQADGLGYRKDDQTFTVKRLVDEDDAKGGSSQSGPSKPATLPPQSPTGPPGPPGRPGTPAAHVPAEGESHVQQTTSTEKVIIDYIPGGQPQMESCDLNLARQEREQSRKRHEMLIKQAEELHELRLSNERAEHQERMKLLRDGCKIDDEDPPDMRVWRFRRDYWP